MTKKRDTYRYRLKDGNKTVYVGSTNDVNRRLSEHKSSGKQFTGHEVIKQPVTKDSARQWEKSTLENYRKRNKGKNPKYNDSNSG